jgi:hypothetical protein
VKWSIDSADAYSIAKVRRAVIDTMRAMTPGNADFFTLESVLGEMLGAEMQRGHLALVVTIEAGVGGPCIHLYTQGRPSLSEPNDELRDAILRASRIPMSIETSNQGTHICIRVPGGHEAPLKTGSTRRVKANLDA